MIRTTLALVLLLASAQPVFAQTGCVNGVLADPRGYFFALIHRAEGQPADDFQAVLRASGLPGGYPPNVVPGDNGFFGLTQQIGGGGRIAGRIFLPTAQPDDLGYYSLPVSPLRDGPTPGSLVWEWRELGGPPYAPRPCGTVEPPTTPHVTPPTAPSVPVVPDELLEAIQALKDLQKAIELLRGDVDAMKNRPFPCVSGRIGGAVPVTLCPR